LFIVARGDGGGVVMRLVRVWFCGISIGYALGGEVLWVLGEVGVVCASRNFVSASLPPCSLRMSDALCNVGVNWMVPSWRGQDCDMEGSSHSWHVNPSFSMACVVGIG